MCPIMGRPKVDNPKDIDVKVRFDKKSHDELMEYCEKHQITRTEAIRRGIHLLLGQDK